MRNAALSLMAFVLLVSSPNLWAFEPDTNAKL